MKKLLTLVLICLTTFAFSQEKKDSDTGKKPTTEAAKPIADSIAIISVDHVKELLKYYQSTLTVNEYNKVYPAIAELVGIAAAQYQKKSKPK